MKKEKYDENYAWSVVSSELNRKVSDTISQFWYKFEEDKTISAREMAIVAQALWGATAGIVDEECMQLMQDIANMETD